jgi:hypothetical protein
MSRDVAGVLLYWEETVRTYMYLCTYCVLCIVLYTVLCTVLYMYIYMHYVCTFLSKDVAGVLLYWEETVRTMCVCAYVCMCVNVCICICICMCIMYVCVCPYATV